MIGGHSFKRLRNRRGTRRTPVRPNTDTLLELLSRCVIEPFARVTDLSALAIPMASAAMEKVEDPPPNPGHPVCAQYSDSDYCRESWLLHLAELRRRPGTHWHKCDYGRLCAVVPIVHHDRCLAAVKLACFASMPEDRFQHHVALLAMLVQGFVVSHAEFLSRLRCAEPPAPETNGPPSVSAGEPLDRHPNHPHVLRALEYIEEHLSDPKLTVAHAALDLDTHPDYLAHLFATQVGQRMSAYITDRRIERAKNLLVTTNWQVKRIAGEAGYANPNWFHHVFKLHTGHTPADYRRGASER